MDGLCNITSDMQLCPPWSLDLLAYLLAKLCEGRCCWCSSVALRGPSGALRSTGAQELVREEVLEGRDLEVMYQFSTGAECIILY